MISIFLVPDQNRVEVHHSPECHRISDLAMEPYVFVCREQPRKFGTDDFDDVPEHGDQDHASVESKDKTSTTGSPYRDPESV